MKLKRINRKQAINYINTHSNHRLNGDERLSLELLTAQAQLDSCQLQVDELVGEIFDAYDGMLDGMGLDEDNFKVSDWEYIQSLKQKWGVK